MNYQKYKAISYAASKMEELKLKTPRAAIKRFSGFFSVIEAKKILWQLYKSWCDSELVRSSDERSDTLFFYELMCAVVEAIHIRKMKKKKKRQAK